MTLMRLDRESITVSFDVLPRKSTDTGTIKRYAEIQREADMPPPKVFHDEDAGCYWLADGLYRLKGNELVSENGEVLCDVVKGSKLDAMWYASGANRDHGLPLTQAERQVALQHAIIAANGEKPDTEIATLVGMSPARVGQVRQKMERAGQVAPKVEQVNRFREDGTRSKSRKPARPKASKPSKPGPKPKDKPKDEPRVRRRVERDDAGTEIPEFLAPMRSQIREMQALQTRVNDLIGDAGRLSRLPVGRAMNFRELKTLLDEARRMLDEATPLFVCQTCAARGSTRNDCVCGGLGWLTRATFNATYDG